MPQYDMPEYAIPSMFSHISGAKELPEHEPVQLHPELLQLCRGFAGERILAGYGGGRFAPALEEALKTPIRLRYYCGWMGGGAILEARLHGALITGTALDPEGREFWAKAQVLLRQYNEQLAVYNRPPGVWYI